MLIDGTILAIKTDERQHKSYDKNDEESRYNDLSMQHNGKFLFIRFNPDEYIDKSGEKYEVLFKSDRSKNMRKVNLRPSMLKKMKNIPNE